MNILIIVAMFQYVEGYHKPNSEATFTDLYSHLNNFIGCTNRINNLPGWDIDGVSLTVPVVLHRYFAYDGSDVVYPNEIRL